MSINDNNCNSGEPPENFEHLSEFKALIDTLQTTPGLEPEPGFTGRVMSAVYGQRRSVSKRRDGYPVSARLQRVLAGLTQTASAKDIALCFLLAGFFYLVLGLVLYFGLKSAAAAGPLSGWIAIQPYLAFGFAAGLGAMGALILADGPTALRIAHLGTVTYIVLVLSNAVLLQISPARPFNVYGILFFTAGSLLLGIFLVTAVRKFWQNALHTADSCIT
jgi:hypothetical protein